MKKTFLTLIYYSIIVFFYLFFAVLGGIIWLEMRNCIRIFGCKKGWGDIHFPPPYWKLRRIIKSRKQLATNNWKQRLLFMYIVGYSYFYLFGNVICFSSDDFCSALGNPKTNLLNNIFWNGEWLLPDLTFYDKKSTTAPYKSWKKGLRNCPQGHQKTGNYALVLKRCMTLTLNDGKKI
jgi:hypothetical protein